MKLAGCPTLANPADKLVGQGFCDLGFIASIALKHPRMKGSDALLQFFAHDLFNQDLDSAHGQATQIEEMKETF